MDPYRSEEEQLRAIRQWWERNGSSTMIGVGLALAIVFGWQWWQQHTQQRAEQAAALYQQLMQASERAVGDPVQETTAEHLARELQSEHGSERFGDYATLLLAKLLVDKKDFAGAEQQLRALIERHPAERPAWPVRRINALLGRSVDPELGSLARLRLARVLFALDRADEALAQLDLLAAGDFPQEVEELRGDVLRSRSEPAAAEAAYRKAMEHAEAAGGGGRIIELKLRDAQLAAAAPAPEPAQAAPSGAAASAPPEGEAPTPAPEQGESP